MNELGAQRAHTRYRWSKMRKLGPIIPFHDALNTGRILIVSVSSPDSEVETRVVYKSLVGSYLLEQKLSCEKKTAGKLKNF